MDTSAILEGQQVNHDLTMVGQRQRIITLGRFDSQAQVVSMSRVRAQPREGYLERLKMIYAYVIRTKDYATRFRTTESDYSYLPDQNFDWAHTVFMVMFRKSYQMIFQTLWAKLSQLLLQWMQT